MGTSRRARVVAATACVLAASLGAPSDARAAPPPEPPLDPAIAVYVEQIPSGSGSVASSGRSGPRAEIPEPVAARIQDQGGADAPALEEIVSSPALGAPSAASSAGEPDTRGAPPATVTSTSRDDRLLGLVAALLLVTAGIVLARVRRREARGAGGALAPRAAPDSPTRP